MLKPGESSYIYEYMISILAISNEQLPTVIAILNILFGTYFYKIQLEILQHPTQNHHLTSEVLTLLCSVGIKKNPEIST